MTPTTWMPEPGTTLRPCSWEVGFALGSGEPLARCFSRSSPRPIAPWPRTVDELGPVHIDPRLSPPWRVAACSVFLLPLSFSLAAACAVNLSARPNRQGAPEGAPLFNPVGLVDTTHLTRKSWISPSFDAWQRKCSPSAYTFTMEWPWTLFEPIILRSFTLPA